jgi:UDP-2,4-diacetamido-2,4,6-trideoxy-beta-L-altropyranose hydrolase
MTGKRIYLRADGSNHIGLGHIYRLLALAEMLKDKFICTFGIQNPQPEIKTLILQSCCALDDLAVRPYDIEAVHLGKSLSNFDILVLDGYSFNSEYQLTLKSFSKKKIVSIDDVFLYHFYSDIVINHAPGIKETNYSCEPYTKLFLGPKYALIREPFASSNAEKLHPTSFNKIFISFGGADPGNFTCKIVEAISGNVRFDSLTVVTGSAYQHRKELEALLSLNPAIVHIHNSSSYQLFESIQSSDAAIIPSSTMLFEVLAAGTLGIAGYYIDNQKQIYNGFLEENAIYGIGDFNTLTPSRLLHHIKQLSSNQEKITTIKGNIRTLFDGRSKERILSIFDALSKTSSP